MAKLRVAAYARVSSSSEDQLNSFGAQNRNYTDYITSQENWSLVDVYADEGITGTSAEKRKDFQRMLADCRRGKIDRILVKSISRFARNTKECLEAVRELKALGVSVFFEEQNIDTGLVSSETMTAIFASLAQKESESISTNLRWSIQKRMQKGTFVPSTMAFGYERKQGKIVIHTEQAVFVYQIFFRYLCGENTQEIAAWLNQQAADNPVLADRTWTYKAIVRILKNEKYIGNSLWQKTYRTDTWPRKERPNRGEQEQYYAEDTHPSIIEKWAFEKAQELLRQRANSAKTVSQKSPLQSKLICGNCGGFLRRKTINKRNYRSCRTHERDSAACPILQIQESTIEETFCRLFYKLKHDSSILSQMLSSLQLIRNRRTLWSPDIIELNKKISDVTSQVQMLATLNQQSLVDPDIFISKNNELTEQLRAIKLEKERLMDNDSDELIHQTQELIESLECGPEFLPYFDAELFGELVDKVIVESNERLKFRLRNGLELSETIERTVR